MRVSEETRYEQTATQMVETRERRTRWLGLPPGVTQGPPKRYTKDVETGERAQGAVGYMTRRDRENEHGVEASASSHSYDRSESSVCVDGGATD